jgi:hypothetical protein
MKYMNVACTTIQDPSFYNYNDGFEASEFDSLPGSYSAYLDLSD